MDNLIDDLYLVFKVLEEDGYPSEYANTVANAIHTLKEQSNRIKELEMSSPEPDFDCYCE